MAYSIKGVESGTVGNGKKRSTGAKSGTVELILALVTVSKVAPWTVSIMALEFIFPRRFSIAPTTCKSFSAGTARRAVPS